jgi:F-type H+-transporting ATPase subunit b
MNMNATLIGQMLAFGLFVWFCMKFVWPPIIGAMNERAQKIADGLNAAEKAALDLESAQANIEAELSQAKAQAAMIVEQANKRASQLVEDAKTDARAEVEKVKLAAHAEIEQEAIRTREALRSEVAQLSIVGAEKILRKSVDKAAHSEMLNQLAAEL